MKTESKERILFDDHLGCFGEFNSKDLICRKLCALNIRCAIESDQYDLMEFLEDLAYSNENFLKIQ